MLWHALELEAMETLGWNYYENPPEQSMEKGRRNVHESHRVLTGESR